MPYEPFTVRGTDDGRRLIEGLVRGVSGLAPFLGIGAAGWRWVTRGCGGDAKLLALHREPIIIPSDWKVNH